MKQGELVKKYYLLAKENKKEVFDVKLLILEVLNKTSTSFYLDMNDEIEDSKVEMIDKCFNEYFSGKPMAYILGYKYFYGHKFKVNNNVLIPRSETEELVNLIIKEGKKYEENISLVDVGCGSGIIGITLKLANPKWHVYLTDISKEALIVAHDNGEELKADVEYLIGDMLDPLIEQDIKVDVIVSNPPYISRYEIIDASVHKYEPHIALYAPDNGLACYIKLLKKAPLVFKDKGIIFLEIGYKQKDAISELIELYLPNSDYFIFKDINKNDRMVAIYYKKMQLNQ